MSDRTLVMLALLRLKISKSDRNAIIRKMAATMTPRHVVQAIDELEHDPEMVDDDVPKRSTMAAPVAEDEAFYGKNKSGPGQPMVCHRCGMKGHFARFCRVPWEKIDHDKMKNFSGVAIAIYPEHAGEESALDEYGDAMLCGDDDDDDDDDGGADGSLAFAI